MAEQYQQWNMGYTSPFPQYHFNGMYLPPDQSGLYRPPQFPTPTGQLLPGPPLGAPPNLGPHAQAPADDQGKKGKGAAKKGAGKAKKSPKKKPKKPKKKTPTKAELQKKEQAKKVGHLLAGTSADPMDYSVGAPPYAVVEAKAKQKKTMKGQQTKTGKKKKEKDPNAPKRARTAFNFFLDDFREKYKKDHPEAKGVVEVTKAGSQRWKEMSPEEKQPFEEMATKAREAYTKAKEEYEEQGGAAKFKLQKGPPRPPTAYFMFLASFRQEFKEKHPEVKGIKDMSKEAGAKWRAMDQAEKQPFEDKAKSAKEEYNRLKSMTPEERVQATAHITNGKIYEQFM